MSHPVAVVLVVVVVVEVIVVGRCCTLDAWAWGITHHTDRTGVVLVVSAVRIFEISNRIE